MIKIYYIGTKSLLYVGRYYITYIKKLKKQFLMWNAKFHISFLAFSATAFNIKNSGYQALINIPRHVSGKNNKYRINNQFLEN